MRVTGVICEYNPFHNGHALHLARARTLSQADYIVCVMSGSFTQRGDVAILDKWSRARQALLNGADAVFELPALYVLSPADVFARAGVFLLSALGVVTHISFGVEAKALSHLDSLDVLTREETPCLSARIRKGLADGYSLPHARAQALGDITGDPSIAALLHNPNLTLALEYLRALRDIACDITPVPVAREGADYHDASPSSLSSATGVRSALLRNDWDAVANAVPDARVLREAALLPADALDQALLYVLRTSSLEELRILRGMDEGLENRLFSAAQMCSTRAELLNAVKTKRYTYARLARLLTCVLLRVPQSLYLQNQQPPYARLLGMRIDAAPLLRAINTHARLPIINRPGRAFLRQSPVFTLDVRATDVRSLAIGEAARLDLTIPPVLV